MYIYIYSPFRSALRRSTSCCTSNILILLSYACAIIALLLHYCCTTPALLLHCRFTDKGADVQMAAMRLSLYAAPAHALLLHYYCITTVLLDY